jgi:hypothetical protein
LAPSGIGRLELQNFASLGDSAYSSVFSKKDMK